MSTSENKGACPGAHAAPACPVRPHKFVRPLATYFTLIVEPMNPNDWIVLLPKGGRSVETVTAVRKGRLWNRRM